MLDTDTKRRIDTARDILVGKVPDPKSQVEQITIALIYKFMDDMDAAAEEMGGVRTFFAGEFAQYGWAKLMRSGLSGYEMLSRYAEAIERMPQNPGIPVLFRSIFSNAYLPYRDPETLRAFLKIIDEFSYDHSERLGDAYEYLLSVLGSQGDAGQFRTPRHIIDFMVAIVDPKKGETVLDPACGTAGFLISSFKHILAANTDTDGNSTLTPDERGRLARNFTGYDISPDMVRLSLVNLYLHGFVDPHIHEYDTLTSLDRWNEHADVILANPPFMSPKGGIRPHNRFSVRSKRSEVLFVDYMAEHLLPGGRAGIIVPEGIIFQSQTAYKQLRQMLVDEYLVAVISLPAGVFNPYSGVKTSILILDKALARRSDSVLFLKVEHDGYGLGAQRRESEKNDLPQALDEVRAYLQRLRAGEPLADWQPALGLIVAKDKVAANGDYSLSAQRYVKGTVARSWFPLARLGDVCEIAKGSAITRDQVVVGSIPVIAGGQKPSCFHNQANRDGETITVSASGAYAGFVAYFNQPIYASDCSTIKSRNDRVLTKFVYYLLKAKQDDIYGLQVGMGQPHVYSKDLATLEIPLPPLDVQREIVAEVEGYQRVIDGARAVVENYRPHIAVDPEWPMVSIGAICTVERGASPRPIHDFETTATDGANWIKIGDVEARAKYITQTATRITPEGAVLSRRVRPGDLILSNSMSFGRPYIVAIDGYIHDGWLLLRDLSPEVDKDFLYHVLGSDLALQQFQRAATGGVVNNLNSRLVRDVTVPRPPIDIQRAIVAELEAEQALVDGNRELIARLERRIQVTLARVWGEDAPDRAES